MSTTTAAGAKPSLFSMAKKAPEKKAAVKDKDSVTVTGISEQLVRLSLLRGEIKEKEAEVKMLEGSLKGVANEQFMRLYIEQRRRPESFRLEGEEGGSMMVIVQDRYTKVDENKLKVLEDKYSDCLETKTTFSFDADMVTKYEPQIAEAIAGLDIPEDDKALLLIVSQETSVMKGTIERLMQFENPNELYQIIQPICMLKG